MARPGIVVVVETKCSELGRDPKRGRADVHERGIDRIGCAAVGLDIFDGGLCAGDEDDGVFDTQSQGCWERANFKGEDRDRVVIVEASDFPNRSLGEDGVAWKTTPPKRPPAVIQRIDSFNARGMQLVYGCGDCWPHRSFHMDVWADRESRLFCRFWSRSKGVEPESFKVEGLKPIPEIGCRIGRCVDGVWEQVCDQNPGLSSGIKPIPAIGCRIGRCVDGVWEQVCD